MTETTQGTAAAAPAPTPTQAPAPPAAAPGGRRPHVVIVGGGFGGLYAARALKRAPVDVTLVDRTNHHLFQPLLYQVATATLAPSDIAAPIRWLLRRQRNAMVLMAEVEGVDVERRIVRLEEGKELTYDYLILASGARHSYFNHPEWEDMAPGLKNIQDAREIRRRFLLAFEEAEMEDDPARREAWLTFVLVGGGPTGVELAGIIPDIARSALRGEFRRIDTWQTKVILLEGGPRVLPSFPESLSERTRRDLCELGVDVRLNSIVTRIEPEAVYVGGERIPTRTVIWAAGNAASPLGAALGAPRDRAGRVLVEPDLSVPGHPEVFVVGDLAAARWRDKWVPGVAQGAIQGGRAAARNIVRTLRGEPRRPFRYLNKGDMATIGRHRAVADFGRVRTAGWPTWWLWLFLHILYLAGFRNRLSVLLEWGYAYFTYQRGSRLIVGREVGVKAPRGEPAARGPTIAPKW
ncbi:MAG TPA: NAD(P)/FAD-dependent oxidoreductase [Gemmatimonadaceae bacterium]|nr:NAD(P)/FAD-dependent oxidoreductase [Gemmatimonadaceae bacterium]